MATEAVLLDRDKAFSAEKGYGFLTGPFFRGGMLLRDFDEHLYHRRIMQQAFTRPRLVGYLDLTTPGIERGLNEWQPGKHFPLYTSAKKVLLELATEAAVRWDDPAFGIAWPVTEPFLSERDRALPDYAR